MEPKYPKVKRYKNHPKRKSLDELGYFSEDFSEFFQQEGMDFKMFRRMQIMRNLEKSGHITFETENLYQIVHPTPDEIDTEVSNCQLQCVSQVHSSRLNMTVA